MISKVLSVKIWYSNNAKINQFAKNWGPVNRWMYWSRAGHLEKSHSVWGEFKTFIDNIFFITVEIGGKEVLATIQMPVFYLGGILHHIQKWKWTGFFFPTILGSKATNLRLTLYPRHCLTLQSSKKEMSNISTALEWW